jgi:hypothetical protein
MLSRTPTDIRVEQSGQGMSAGTLDVRLDTEAARSKRIDRYIDYFGGEGPRRIGLNLDPCGESLLDAGGTRERSGS